MRIFDLLKLSTRMFKTRLTRTVLTILGVGVGIGAVLFLVSLGYGLQGALLEKITTDEALSNVAVSNPTTSKTLYLNDEIINEFYDIKSVKDVSPLASFPSQATMNNLTGNVIIYGIESTYFKYAGIKMIEGEYFSENERDKIVVSESSLKLFNIKDPKKIIGKKIAFQVFIEEEKKGGNVKVVEVDKKYEVKGVFGGTESSVVYFPLSVLREYVDIKMYESAQVKVGSTKDIENIKEELINKGFMVYSLSETIDEVNKIFDVIKIILGLFGTVALIVSAIGMANTMTVTLLERTNEIGIMKSIGASDRDVGLIFLGEAVVMGFLGGVSGVVIGVVGGELFNAGINFLATNLEGEKIDFFYSPAWFMAIIIISSAFVGLITGIFPARNASKMNPLAALRYK